jgi:hypothetical protein
MINLYLSVSSDRFGKTHIKDSKANLMSVSRMNYQVGHHGYHRGLRLSCSSPFLFFWNFSKKVHGHLCISPESKVYDELGTMRRLLRQVQKYPEKRRPVMKSDLTTDPNNVDLGGTSRASTV